MSIDSVSFLLQSYIINEISDAMNKNNNITNTTSNMTITNTISTNNNNNNVGTVSIQDNMEIINYFIY